MKQLWYLCTIALLAGWFALACDEGDDGDGGSSGDTDTDADCDATVPAEYDQVCPYEVAPCKDGEDQATCNCMVDEDCTSGYCEVYESLPWAQDSKCAQLPPDGTINIVGSVKDFETAELLPNVSVSVADGAQVLSSAEAAYTNPDHLKVVSNGAGRFNDAYVWDIGPQDMGLVSLIQEEGYFFTGTGFVEPTAAGKAPPSVLNHEAMVISETLVATLKGLIAADPEASRTSPNIFGKVAYMDLLDGEGKPLPVQGVIIKSTTDPNMQIYYVDENMDGLTATATTSNGMFIVSTFAAKAKLRAYRCNTPIDYYDSTMGNTPRALVYAVMVPVWSDDDPDAPEINCE